MTVYGSPGRCPGIRAVDVIFPVGFLFIVFVCAFPVAAAGLGLFWLMRLVAGMVARVRRGDDPPFEWEEFEREFREYADSGWAAARHEERHA